MFKFVIVIILGGLGSWPLVHNSASSILFLIILPIPNFFPYPWMELYLCTWTPEPVILNAEYSVINLMAKGEPVWWIIPCCGIHIKNGSETFGRSNISKVYSPSYVNAVSILWIVSSFGVAFTGSTVICHKLAGCWCWNEQAVVPVSIWEDDSEGIVWKEAVGPHITWANFCEYCLSFSFSD